MSNIYVPIRLEAWVKSLKSVQLPTIIQNAPSYDNLKFFDPDILAGPGDSKRRSIMVDDRGKEHGGVYLHWVLPRGFRYGCRKEVSQTSDDDDSTSSSLIEYNRVPDRWLVTRQVQGDTDKTRIWVVESNRILTPQEAKDKDAAVYPGSNGTLKIGRCVSLDDWRPEDPNTDQYVKNFNIQHTGDVLFADYQPHCQDVFSIFDPVATDEKLNHLEQLTLNYSVIGWYSEDPLSDSNLDGSGRLGILSKMHLKLQTEELISESSRLILHGSIYSLNWRRSGDYESIPDKFEKESVRCSIGFNTVDALIGLIQSVPEDLSPDGNTMKVLLHGHFDKITDPISQERIIDDIHKSGFTPHPGGMVWKIVSKTETTGMKPEVQDSIQLTLVQIQSLNELNAEQKKLDLLIRKMRLRQWELFASIWSDKIQSFRPFQSQINGSQLDIAARQSTVTSLQEKVRQAKEQIESKRLDLQKLLNESKPNSPTRESKSYPVEDFWTANDPTLLITGLGNTTWPQDYMEHVLCLRGTELTIITSTAGEISSNLPISDAIIKLFPHFPDLSVNTSRRTQTENYWINTWTSQPWMPLFVSWEAHWVQTSFTQWKLDANRTEDLRPSYYFNIGAKEKALDPSSEPYCDENDIEDRSQVLRGQIIITPHVKKNIEGQIQKLLDDTNFEQCCEEKGSHTKLSFQEAALKNLSSSHLLSQKMGGFLESFIHRRSGAHKILEDPEQRKLIDAQHFQTPLLESAIKAPFQPVAHGQFYFKKLTVVDRFGQAVILTDKNHYHSFDPIKSWTYDPFRQTSRDGFTTVSQLDGRKFIELPPQILQPARINAEWVDISDQSIGSNYGGNPIYGWLLLNYLDQAIQIHDHNGQSLGELKLLNSGGAEWHPFVKSFSCNKYLEFLIRKILGNKDAPLDAVLQVKDDSYLKELIRIVDRAFDKIIVSNTKLEDVSNLVGRPVVLARAKWGLELQEPPYQSWNSGPKGWEPNLCGYQFPIHLGHPDLMQDGLIGFFKAELDVFYSDYQTQNNNIFQNIQKADLNISPYFPDPENMDVKTSEIFTVVIVDPFVPLHAYTGILPVKKLQFPEWVISPAITKMVASFRFGPLLMPQQLQSIRDLQMPIPSGGHWTWLDQDPSGNLTEIQITNSEPPYQFVEGPYSAMEGFLQFKLNDSSK